MYNKTAFFGITLFSCHHYYSNLTPPGPFDRTSCTAQRTALLQMHQSGLLLLFVLPQYKLPFHHEGKNTNYVMIPQLDSKQVICCCSDKFVLSKQELHDS